MLPLLIPAVAGLLDKLIPDPSAAAEAKLKAIELAQKGDLATLDADMRLALGQQEINKVEAGQDNFRGGWRPAAGWACSLALFYDFLLRPILPWVVSLFNVDVQPMPGIDIETLMILLGGLLGLGGLRTMERVKGKA
jgi:hypothetical protein